MSRIPPGGSSENDMPFSTPRLSFSSTPRVTKSGGLGGGASRPRGNARWKGHDDAKVVFRVALSGRSRSLGHGCLSPRAALVYRHSHRRSSDRPRLWHRYECTDAGAAWLAGDGDRLLTPGYSSRPKKARRLRLQRRPSAARCDRSVRIGGTVRSGSRPWLLPRPYTGGPGTVHPSPGAAGRTRRHVSALHLPAGLTCGAALPGGWGRGGG